YRNATKAAAPTADTTQPIIENRESVNSRRRRTIRVTIANVRHDDNNPANGSQFSKRGQFGSQGFVKSLMRITRPVSSARFRIPKTIANNSIDRKKEPTAIPQRRERLQVKLIIPPTGCQQIWSRKRRTEHPGQSSSRTTAGGRSV